MEKYNRRNAEMKKYDLALKNRIYNKTSSNIEENKINEKMNENKFEHYDPMNSQNIKLRISESFTLDDSDDELNPPKLLKNNELKNVKNNEVIIISDSSEDEESLNFFEKPKPQNFQSCLKPKNTKNLRDSSTGFDSIELSDEDSDVFTGSLRKKSENSENPGKVMKNTSRTSEETNFDFGVDESRGSIVDSSLKGDPKPQVTPINKNLFETPKKLSQVTTPLSKKDAKRIMNLIKSKRIESPVVARKIESSDDEIVTDEEHEVQHPAWIDESDEVEELPIAKPAKTHVTRFLNPAIEPSDDLSEEKKREISRWLMYNPESPRDDSSSVISTSLKNASSTSGDSSLDRLEMNYETPNNRDKFRGGSTIKSRNDTTRRDVQTPRQTVMDDFMKKSRSRPKSKTSESPLISKAKPAPVVETPKTALVDCADILDKLYGETWRQRTNAPTTEPRRAPLLQDRGVQTERIKKKKTTSDADFKKFIRDIRPEFNSTKKQNYRNSFIDDSSDSGDGDTTYATARTHPRISGEELRRRETPMTANTIKAIEICDSDSDSGVKRGGNRRRLSFSDDEKDRSSTSEYDPEDFVPPKVLPKTINKADKFKRNLGTHKGFLTSLSGSVAMEQCHPEAKKYRINFKNNKEELVKHLYKLYNEKIFDNQLPKDMLIEWNVRMRGTAGFCYNKRVKNLTGFTRTSRMALATKILDRPDRLRDTLVHEMCHAAAWIINDVSDGHGPFWKSWASKAMRVFPELPPIKRCHDYEISTKFTYRCVQCGYSIGRHSKSLDIEKKRCGHCFGKFELLLNKVTKSGAKLQIPRTPKAREPTAFALFVKENYSTLKKERRGMAHKEVMQLLGQQFSAIKLSKKNDNEPNSSEHST